MATNITYATILDCRQHLQYNVPTTDGNGNPAYQFVVITTDIKTQGSDGSVRDIQTRTNYGGVQATPYTPQQIYTIMNTTTAAGTDLAAELKANYLMAIGTAVN
jgi:hypothetical protein